jgi:ring-1,2-phenylacetyl-CoA epoxidase subunit PaaD
VTTLRRSTAGGDQPVDDLLDAAWRAAGAVTDPEVPVLTIADLGVLRSVERTGHGVAVTITPTYSGCPAMEHIAAQVAEAVGGLGVDVEVRTVLSPAWTTDWLTDEGRSKLTAYGIAPPRRAAERGGGPVAVALRRAVRCPRCGSSRTTVVSEFGSTACKALHRCTDCLEPFDHFKEL